MAVHPENIEAGKLFGVRNEFKVCTGACYFGGNIGNHKYKCNLLKERTATWERNIRMIRKTAGRYPQ